MKDLVFIFYFIRKMKNSLISTKVYSFELTTVLHWVSYSLHDLPYAKTCSAWLFRTTSQQHWHSLKKHLPVRSSIPLSVWACLKWERYCQCYFSFQFFISTRFDLIWMHKNDRLKHLLNSFDDSYPHTYLVYIWFSCSYYTEKKKCEIKLERIIFI